MSRLATVADNRTTLKSKGILEQFQLRHAQTPNFLNLLSRSASVARAYAAAEQALAGGKLTAQQREQIALAVAEINDSRYSLAAHTATGRDAGLSEDEIWLARKAGANGRKAEAMLRFTQAVALQRGRISQNEIAALRKEGFSESELIEIIANIALNVFTNYLNIVFKTQVDFPLLHPESGSQPAAEKQFNSAKTMGAAAGSAQS